MRQLSLLTIRKRKVQYQLQQKRAKVGHQLGRSRVLLFARPRVPALSLRGWAVCNLFSSP